MFTEEDIKNFQQQYWDKTQRSMRASRSADVILKMVQDFVPRDSQTFSRLSHILTMECFIANLEIIHVPDECDELDKIALEKMRLQISLEGIELSNDQKDEG